MLSAWRRDVSRYLTQRDALSSLPKSKKPYGLAAWHFLNGAPAPPRRMGTPRRPARLAPAAAGMGLRADP